MKTIKKLIILISLSFSLPAFATTCPALSIDKNSQLNIPSGWNNFMSGDKPAGNIEFESALYIKSAGIYYRTVICQYHANNGELITLQSVKQYPKPTGRYWDGDTQFSYALICIGTIQDCAF